MVLVLLGYGGGGGGCGVVCLLVRVLPSTLAKLGWAFLLVMMVEWVIWRLGMGSVVMVLDVGV